MHADEQALHGAAGLGSRLVQVAEYLLFQETAIRRLQPEIKTATCGQFWRPMK
ncbi:hypothetical protein [Achromobacter xylosoxidans]|uniref:hypothetical protein n=1 Tax=Alcaligenes xylosoxydans xylosoxydans TaxID=85698 RepID=UPI00165D8B51|nr:hypothetical protein [Achromobacter xylosoxidans]